MGREIRRVPPNWEHPRWTEEELKYCAINREAGDYKSMYNQTYKEAAKEWKEGFLKWESGDGEEYWECESPPDPNYYRPEFTEEPTWYQAYQTVSEGSPVSPPFATEEELIEYLVENGDFWYQNEQEEIKSGKKRMFGLGPFYSKPSRESATAFVKGGWAPSMTVMTSSEGVVMKEGINAL